MTTLIRLLLSLINPSKGYIEYTDENGTKEFAQPASRRFISYVTQGNTLLSESIKSNLLVEKRCIRRRVMECFPPYKCEKIYQKKQKKGLIHC